MPRTKHIDTSKFEGVMAEAMKAYSLDPDLACQMARNASAILRKRLSWTCRSELRRAEAEAVAACRMQPTFTCTNPSPCGTGGCRWATGDLALLDLPEVPGKSQRPQPRDGHATFDVEQALKPLLELRAGRSSLASFG